MKKLTKISLKNASGIMTKEELKNVRGTSNTECGNNDSSCSGHCVQILGSKTCTSFTSSMGGITVYGCQCI